MLQKRKEKVFQKEKGARAVCVTLTESCIAQHEQSNNFDANHTNKKLINVTRRY